MVGLVLTPEHVKAAPPEVRAWLRGIVDAELGPLLGLAHEPTHERPHDAAEALATLSLSDAASILQRLGADYPACQVFFEFGRDVPGAAPSGPLHRVSIAELARRTRIADGRRLLGCIETLNAVFQAVRGDPGASLFAFDQQGGCYVHVTTHQSIRELWHEVVSGRIESTPDPATRAA